MKTRSRKEESEVNEAEDDASAEEALGAPTTPIPSLPPELWHMILEFILATPDNRTPKSWYQKGSKRLILPFAFACKAFFSLAVSLLYKNVNIAETLQRPVTSEHIAKFMTDSLGTHKLLFVRSLKLPTNVSVADLGNLLARCPRVEELALTYGKSDILNSALRLLKRRPSNLLKITLDLAIRGALKALESAPAVCFPPSIREVCFRDAYSVDHRSLLALVERSPNVQTIGELPDLGSRTTTVNLAAFPTSAPKIVSLTTNVRYLTPNAHLLTGLKKLKLYRLGEAFEAMWRVLSRLPRLEELQIDGLGSDVILTIDLFTARLDRLVLSFFIYKLIEDEAWERSSLLLVEKVNQVRIGFANYSGIWSSPEAKL